MSTMAGSNRTDEARGAAKSRPRARDIGLDIGILRPGRLGAITDVRDVKVGHCTLVEGEGILIPGKGPVRTGVTAVIPHEGSLFREKVPAAAYAFNAFGKSVGLQQVNELGNLEVPVLLTNTLNVPLVADAVVEWSVRENPEIGIRTGTVNPVVGEVNDGFLNDIQGRHVRREHVFEAIGAARPGPVEEGSIGAGLGCSCLGWKGGIGTSSRVLPASGGGYTVGVLVQTNFGGILTVNGAPVGRELGRHAFRRDLPQEDLGTQEPGGSVMVVMATDAPLDQRQLERLAKRASLGLARTGFIGANASGDFFIAFSTAFRVPHEGQLALQREIASNDAMSALFLAAIEATEEAVLNSLLKATTVTGRDGNVVEAIDIGALLRVLRRHGALAASDGAAGPHDVPGPTGY